MVLNATQEQSMRLLEAGLQAIKNVQDHALYERANGQYEIITITWFHRIVRYFVPEWYDSVQHLPKLSKLMLEASQANSSLVNYTKMTESLEALLFKDIKWQKDDIQRDSSKQKLHLANQAVDSLLSLRDVFVMKPKPSLTLQPVVDALKGSNRWSHEEFSKAILTSIKAVQPTEQKAATFSKELDDLLLKVKAFATTIPGFWPRELAAIILQMQRFAASTHPLFAEIVAHYKADVERDLVKKMQSLLDEPCKEPNELNWHFCDYTKILGWDAFHAFIAKPEVARLAEALRKKMYATLHVEHQRVGNVSVAAESLAQASKPESFENVVPQFQSMLPRLSEWQTRLCNYTAVCNTFQRESLAKTQIGRESLITLLPADIPDNLKVPFLCEALLTKAKKLLPAKPENELQQMIAEAVSLVAIEAPNPISLPREFLGIYLYLSPVNNLLLTDEQNTTQNLKAHFEFDLKKDKETLAVTYRTHRAFTLKEFSKPDYKEPLGELSLLFTAKLDKSFTKPEAPWRGQLRAEKH